MLIEVDGRRPELAAQAWVAANATLAGRVRLGRGASVWYCAVLRAEFEDITVGAASNVQDGCALHVDAGRPLSIGAHVSIGHNAVLHGCTVDDEVLVGMGAVVMNGAHVGSGTIVAAGALVAEDVDVPAGSLVAGVPGRVRRELTADERALVRANAEGYLELARRHAAGVEL